MTDKWKLIYVPSGETIAYGNYSLCRYKMNLLTDSTGYKIVPFTFKMKCHAGI